MRAAPEPRLLCARLVSTLRAAPAAYDRMRLRKADGLIPSLARKRRLN